MAKNIQGLEKRQGPIRTESGSVSDYRDLIVGDRIKLMHQDGEIYVHVSIIDEDRLIVGKVIGTRGVIKDIWIDDIVRIHQKYVSVLIKG